MLLSQDRCDDSAADLAAAEELGSTVTINQGTSHSCDFHECNTHSTKLDSDFLYHDDGMIRKHKYGPLGRVCSARLESRNQLRDDALDAVMLSSLSILSISESKLTPGRKPESAHCPLNFYSVLGSQCKSFCKV